jgi:pimeloyl-ACP methyl ester carboxylesterase
MSRRTFLAVARLVVVLLMVTTSGCTSATSPPEARRPAWEPVECPRDVAGVVIGSVECGFVRVPARHDSPTQSPVLRLFVTRVKAPRSTPGAEPVVVAGTSFASVPNYLGVAPLAQRTGREVVIVDPRGVGHSQPSLDCPQVHGVAEDTRAGRTGPLLMAEVAACHTDLTADGLDLTDFDATAMAQDLEVVRRAIGVERWVVAAYGSASLIVAELLRLHPEPVSAVVLDSPLLPGMDPIAPARERLAAVVDGVVDRCRSSTTCSRRFGAAGLSWRSAVAEVTRRPLILRPPGGDPGESLVLDRGLLLRALRQMTTDGGSSGTALTLDSLPAVLRHVVDRDAARLSRGLGEALLAQEAFCLGRAPSCLAPRHHVSVGVWLTTMCGQLVPGASPSTEEERRMTGADLCDAWPVPPGPALPPVSDDWQVPTLVAVGRWSTHVSPSAIREATGPATRVTWVEDPSGGNNVLPASACLLGIRDAWLSDPGTDVATECLAHERLQWEGR